MRLSVLLGHTRQAEPNELHRVAMYLLPNGKQQ